MKKSIFNHPLSPIGRRGLYAIAAVVIVVGVGTIGTELLTGWSWIDSFYFFTMVATAEGPPNSPPTFWSKIFTAVMAYVSIGTLITAVGVLFGPFLGYAWHKGIRFAEMEIEKGDVKKEPE
ncbi:MAG: hypothetical protein OK439_05190 [Thaumarchaeota archaeon]|nr:hypothetical protein [Nitrososphaerota archaeon]